jgi:exopolysaccharide biosynthesis polyprenyl glycosylphosphotransferase
VVVPAWRIIFSSTVVRALGSKKLLFIGSSDSVQEIGAQLAERPEFGMVAVGYVDDGLTPTVLRGIRRLGPIADLSQIVASEQPDRIVVGVGDRRGSMPLEQLLALRFGGMPIEEAASTYEAVFRRVSTRDLRPAQLIFSSDIGPGRYTTMLQSAYSWLIGAAGLIVASPVMLAVGILVKLTSPGPVFFRQMRVGLHGRHFTLYKFRSMRQDAEAETGAVWAAKNDPRATRLGRWLRRLRLDELPQLLNVVRGEMAIVGPRPERPEFVEELQQRIPYYRQRLCVKPGITGWAQINHKYGDTIEDTVIKLEYDLYYIKHLSTALDLFVMFHTLKTVLTGRGAQ